MKQRRGQLGFTLIELLLASAIMVVILSALGSLFVSTSRAYRTNDEASNLQQNAEAAGQLLTYEIRLAGYRGSDNNVAMRTFTTPVLLGTVTIPATTLQIENTPPTSPDKITVSYYEDRFTGSTTRRTTQFSVDTNDNNLYRYASTYNSKEAAIEGVHNLKVLRYIRNDGKECNTATASSLAALKLELTLTKELKKQVVIALPNTQITPILPTLTALSNPTGC